MTNWVDRPARRYKHGEALLSVIQDLNTDIETLWSEISEKLKTENQLLWSGSINHLLIGDKSFEVDFREGFYDSMGMDESNKPEQPNIMESLIEYLDGYCWG